VMEPALSSIARDGARAIGTSTRSIDQEIINA
jgi:hypothetical protein